MIHKKRPHYKELLTFAASSHMSDCTNGFGGKISSWRFDPVCYAFSHYCTRKLYITPINKVNVIVYFERESSKYVYISHTPLTSIFKKLGFDIFNFIEYAVTKQRTPPSV